MWPGRCTSASTSDWQWNSRLPDDEYVGIAACALPSITKANRTFASLLSRDHPLVTVERESYKAASYMVPKCHSGMHRMHDGRFPSRQHRRMSLRIPRIPISRCTEEQLAAFSYVAE